MSSGESDEAGSDPRASDSSDDLGFAQTVTPPAGTPAVANPAVAHTLDSAIAERPDPDKLHRAVARSRVGAKLFAKKAEAVKLGRYHLLEMVGSGGMGVVWGAWDPELDRRVAIKLVKAEMQAARDRILIEGQALAKLSHPNVVPVYDVGIVDEQVYLVMEWVRGKNLRAFCKEPRSIREIVTVYRAAGEGLSAAHRVGLIHRDFKPDNAMIGDDGRVRVLDFGLARGEVKAKPKAEDGVERFSSDLTRGAGTPRYMPPEQAEGAELTPAVDQYALGVSLREALVGRNADGKDADVPRWLDDILTRATSREASNRFASMDALVHALARDPATIWRRRGIVAGALALAGGMFVVGTVQAGGDAAETCAGGTDEIAKAWNPSTSDALVSHLTSLGPYGAEEAKRLVPDMTKYGQRWAATHKRVCMANDRKELTAQLYDVRLACLSRAQVALQTVTEILGRANKERLPDAIVASRALPEVELCATQTSSTIEPPPSAIKTEVDALATQVSRIRYLAMAVDPAAKSIAAETAARADKLGYSPLIGQAHLALGFGLIGDGKGALEAIPEFGRARAAALRASDLVTFVEAYAREVYAIGRAGAQPNAVDVDATFAMVDDLARGMKNEGVFARTLLLNNLGTQRLSRGRVDEARRFFERAVAEPQHGKRDLELNVIVGNLAMVTEDPHKRRELFLEERRGLERELGTNHPLTIAALLRSAAHSLDDPNDAAEVLRDACARLTTWHPDAQGRIDTCSYELGWLAAERGDVAGMKTAMAAIKLPTSQYTKVAAGYLMFADGKVADVAREMEAYGLTKVGEPDWPPRMVGANALILAATAYEKLGQPERAIAMLERTLQVFEDPGLNKLASYYKRRVARARAMLAKLIAKTKPETAKSLANEALTWYRQAGGYESTIAELEAL